MSPIHIATGMNRPTMAYDCDEYLANDESALALARARLTASHVEYERSKSPRNEIYYPVKRTNDEEPVRDIVSNDSLDGIVTRNHYGSLVLNAHHALFIDVDMPGSGGPSGQGHSLRRDVPDDWKTIFDALSIVLASERHTGFRIYRTAAGFRILANTHEFEPGSECADALMTSVGADRQFVRLCGTQKTFRARLTPKPWRCGTTEPPNKFPRQSADEQHSFSKWLLGYKIACRKRATCQFLKQVGPQEMHRRLRPIIELHDRATKSNEELELA
jgi:hypothetical protein